MKIELNVSNKNEGTSAPYWLILDPKQNMDCDIHSMAFHITGPFFSREEAENELQATKYNYSHRAKVYCMSGCHSHQYFDVWKLAEQL
jgi:predicted LPLAT superfamily acyltransferase